MESEKGVILERKFNWTWEGEKAGTIISVSPAGSIDEKHFHIEIRAFTKGDRDCDFIREKWFIREEIAKQLLETLKDWFDQKKGGNDGDQ